MHGAPLARDVGAFGDKSLQHFVGTVSNQPCTSAPVCSHATELPDFLFISIITVSGRHVRSAWTVAASVTGLAARPRNTVAMRPVPVRRRELDRIRALAS